MANGRPNGWTKHGSEWRLIKEQRTEGLNPVTKSHLRSPVDLSEGGDGTVIPQPHSCMGLVCMHQTRQMMTKCICWTQQGHCTHEHTVAGTTYVSPAPDHAGQNPSMLVWGGAREISPLPEELLAVNGSWGRESQLYLNDASPEKLNAAADSSVPMHTWASQSGPSRFSEKNT